MPHHLTVISYWYSTSARASFGAASERHHRATLDLKRLVPRDIPGTGESLGWRCDGSSKQGPGRSGHLVWPRPVVAVRRRRSGLCIQFVPGDAQRRDIRLLSKGATSCQSVPRKCAVLYRTGSDRPDWAIERSVSGAVAELGKTCNPIGRRQTYRK